MISEPGIKFYLTWNVSSQFSGDTRSNENIGLTAWYTVLMRYHNYIEQQLYDLNPDWDGEKLFQETRHICIAVWQHIIYNEFLPTTLGPGAMTKYALWVQKEGPWDRKWIFFWSRECHHFDDIFVAGCNESCHLTTFGAASEKNIIKWWHFRFSVWTYHDVPFPSRLLQHWADTNPIFKLKWVMRSERWKTYANKTILKKTRKKIFLWAQK